MRIQVIGRQVQQRGYGDFEHTAAFQLKTGQLQNVDVGLRVEQVQRRSAEIAARRRVPAGGRQRCSGHGGDRALAV